MSQEVSKDSHGLGMWHPSQITSCGPSERIHMEAGPGNNFFSWSDTRGPWWWPYKVVTSQWEFSLRQNFLGYLHPQMRLGIPPPLWQLPGVTQDVQTLTHPNVPGALSFPHTKMGWWEKGKAPLSLPCALRGAADASARWGRLGQPRTPCTGMDRDKGILLWELLPSMGKMDWELSSRIG